MSPRPFLPAFALAITLVAPAFAAAQGAPADAGWTSPKPEKPVAVSWSNGDWALMVGAATIGELAGGVGAVALYWTLAGICENRDASSCYRGHRPSSLAIGLALGAPIGATLGAGITGAALGYEGTAVRTYAGALVSLTMFAAAFGPFVDPEVSVPLGTGMALAFMPWGTALFYNISQEDAARIGESASLVRFAPDRGFSWGIPAVTALPYREKLILSVPLGGGTF